MGMYDSIFIECPKCGNEVEFQSKAGDCSLMDYTLEDCPNVIRQDLMGEAEKCDNCHHIVKISGPKEIPIPLNIT